jgi:hypothetical protein
MAETMIPIIRKVICEKQKYPYHPGIGRDAENPEMIDKRI